MRQRVTTLVPALLLPFILMMTPVFAISAAPGDTLYPAKLKLESVRLSLATNPLSEIGLHLDFASLRLEELAGLLDMPNPNSKLVEVVSQNFKGHVEEAQEGLRVLKNRGDAEGPRAALLKTKVVQTAALSETVRWQCGQPEAPVTAAGACLSIQPALTTTLNEFTELVVPDARERIFIAMPPPPAPADSGSSNTFAKNAEPAPPAESSKVSAEPGTGTTTSKESAASADKPVASGDKSAGSSGGDSPKPAPPAAETAASPEPEPTPPEPIPSPTETPTSTEPPPSPPPPSGDQAPAEAGAPPPTPAGTAPQPQVE